MLKNKTPFESLRYASKAFYPSKSDGLFGASEVEGCVRSVSKYPNISFTILNKNISKVLQLDIEKYNTQYHNLEVKISSKYHDRFLIIDNAIVYHIGASLKDLAKKVFAFSVIDITLLGKLK